MNFNQKHFKVHFITPAFLGNAERKGQWRVPPFKALIRRWWRILVAKDLNYEWEKIRRKEGVIFGHSWLKDRTNKPWAMKSIFKIKIDNWKKGTNFKESLISKPISKIRHTELSFQIDPLLYLGYGPINYHRSFQRIQNFPPSIKEEDEMKISMYGELTEIIKVIPLLHIFGTIGGRARNGWGSIEIIKDNNGEIDIPKIENFINFKEIRDQYLNECSRQWNKCLEKDWPHAIGKDEKGFLIWRTREFYSNWYEVMKELAEIKIKFRTQFSFSGSIPHSRLFERHLIAYPVTNHEYNPWGRQARYPNQLMFKIHRSDNGKFLGIAFHIPHTLPNELSKNVDLSSLKSMEINTWRKVHHILDENMVRLP